jgi:hypothetical protein
MGWNWFNEMLFTTGIFASLGRLFRRIWPEAVYMRRTVGIYGKPDVTLKRLS